MRSPHRISVPRPVARAPGRFLLELWHDVRYGARTLRKQPGFAAVVIVTLALSVGGTTGIFSVVHGVLIKPLPYPDSDALVRIVHSISGLEQPYLSDAIFLTYVDNTQTLQDLGAWTPEETAAITGQGVPEEVRVLRASGGVLPTLGVGPAIGRWFSAADDTPGSPDTVILTNGYWKRRFGGDPTVLERTLTLNGRPHQVIGVMPPHFRFDSEREFEIVLPLRINRAALRRDSGSSASRG
jgi:putative ABC transport system permease protein